MKHHEIAGLMTALAPVVGDFVAKAMAPLRAENQALHGRLNEIEQRFAGLPSKEENSVLILRLVEETVAKIPPAEPGKDADPALVADLVDKAVAALPPAKDGEQGPAGDSVTVDQLAPLVAETVAKVVSDEMEKIAANLPAGKDGAPGEPGKSVTVGDVMPLVAEEVAKAVSGIEPPAVDWSEVDKMIGDKVTEAVEAIPPAAPGKDADPALVKEIVAQAIAELPRAKDGADGKEGPPGRDGRDGLPGVQGEKGADGRHGIDGKDGLGIDDFDVKSIDDGRVLEFSLKREGAEPLTKRVDLATVLDRGVWREQGYSKGDGVTWGGSFFIAQRASEAAEKPGASDAWRLSVKKGRDGKDGAPGKPGERGPKGEPARNLV